MFLKTNGVRLFFDVANKGVISGADGTNTLKPPCFALHGGPGGSHLDIRDTLDGISDRVQLVFHDQRGCGFSDRIPVEKLSMSAMSQDIEQLRLHLGLEGKGIILMGFSYGGMQALDYVLRYPEAVSMLILVVTAPSYAFIDDARKGLSSVKDESLKRHAEKILTGTLKDEDDMRETIAELNVLYSAKPNVKRVKEIVKKAEVRPEVLNWFFGGAAKSFNVVERLSSIKTPTLIVAGDRDWICPLSQSQIMHERIPGSELVVFQGGHHLLFADENEKFIGVVRNFMNGKR